MDKQKFAQWKGFKGDKWKESIDVQDFILSNYKEYRGDDKFLCGPSAKTQKVWAKCNTLLKKESKLGLLDVELTTISGINTFAPGYIDKKNEVVVGLQTDQPLKRIVNLYGGLRTAEKALAAYGKELDPEIRRHFVEYRKTHNDGVFDAYTPEIRKARSAGLLTGLPDAYGRGRIIGDYRRVALYGIDLLIEEKKQDK
ncbi:MAG: formate acetyltransferase, partial [Clostridia bacterium]|nr:formate acetyltransferase [Clostridia bacterium]